MFFSSLFVAFSPSPSPSSGSSGSVRCFSADAESLEEAQRRLAPFFHAGDNPIIRRIVAIFSVWIYLSLRYIVIVESSGDVGIAPG